MIKIIIYAKFERETWMLQTKKNFHTKMLLK